jgi:GH15 family glucan-1,4-alpha-glucosidase
MIDLFAHSVELIRANQSPSGAYVASPTFPTYHYCWFRDGTYIAYAMDRLGEHDSARRFYGWAMAMVIQRAAAVERAIAAAPGGQPAPADLLDTRYSLDGAVGTEEWPNFQLDGFGTLLWGVREHLALTAAALPGDWRPAIGLLARYLAALWRLPCYDCWEEFGDRVHTATLAALYGGLSAAAELLGDASHAHTAAAIRAYVLDRCVTGGCLSKFVGSSAVDASLLHVATPYRLLAPDDPLMRATVARIESELRRAGGGVHRYADDSYYGGGEWVLLTAYLGWHYVERGEPERAQPLLAWIERSATAEGLLPEQVAAHLNHPDMLPVWNERWGTSACPLLWSHAAYLTLATRLRHENDKPSS